MTIKTFIGKIGRERFLKDFDLEHLNVFAPRRKDLIMLDGNIYRVLDVIQDYDLDEYNVFLEKFNWED